MRTLAINQSEIDGILLREMELMELDQLEKFRKLTTDEIKSFGLRMSSMNKEIPVLRIEMKNHELLEMPITSGIQVYACCEFIKRLTSHEMNFSKYGQFALDIERAACEFRRLSQLN